MDDRLSSLAVAVTDGYSHPIFAHTKSPSNIGASSEVGEILDYSSTGGCLLCSNVTVIDLKEDYTLLHSCSTSFLIVYMYS